MNFLQSRVITVSLVLVFFNLRNLMERGNKVSGKKYNSKYKKSYLRSIQIDLLTSVQNMSCQKYLKNCLCDELYSKTPRL
jgi:hypothetical protein